MNDHPQPPKPRKGCLFYGCLTLAVLSLAVLVGGGLGLYFLYQKVEALVETHAAAGPMELPPAHYTAVDQQQFDARLDAFVAGMDEGKPTVPLVLRGEDLNMLLASSPDLKALANGIRARVEGDEIRGLVSLKLGDLGAPFFKDRYLNGEAAFKVAFTNGMLRVTASELRVNGKALPEEYLAALREHNLAEGVNQNPEVSQTLEKIASIEVKDGAVQVAPKTAE